MNEQLAKEPISNAALIVLGYSLHTTLRYFCPPEPANGATYRLEFSATIFKKGKPVEGTEKWRAYLTHPDRPTVRRFETLGELNDFHKGMCGVYLF